jgi:hypothetical protein
MDGLDRAGGGRPEHVLAPLVAGVEIVQERLLPHGEDVRREEGALPVSLAARQVDDDFHRPLPRRASTRARSSVAAAWPVLAYPGRPAL